MTFCTVYMWKDIFFLSDWITQRVVDVYSKQGSGERLVSFKRGRRINLAQCHKAVFPSRITGNVLRNTAGPHSVRTFLVVSHPATFFDCYFYADAAKKKITAFFPFAFMMRRRCYFRGRVFVVMVGVSVQQDW